MTFLAHLILSASLASAAPVGVAFDEVGDPSTHREHDLGQPDREVAVPHIINGREATVDEWPSSGGILSRIEASAFGFNITSVLFTCSSTLIAPDVVLTAAHCVDESVLEMQTGGFVDFDSVTYAWTPEVDLSGYGLGGPSEYPDDAIRVIDLALHPEWIGADRIQLGVAFNHDIALMFLEEPVFDRPYAYLPLPEEADQLVTDAPVVIVGWGNQEPVPPGQQPEAGKVGIKHVADSFIGYVGESEFQVGVGPESTRKCQGDSGGPTYQEVETNLEDRWRVIGATSHTWDMQLCENTGGVDTRADYYLDWINQQMRSRCVDGTRVWCDEIGLLCPDRLLGDEDER
jgi:hypothetical protein